MLSLWQQKGDCWQLIEDAKLVPTIINTVRFNKLVSHRDQTEYLDNGIASPGNGGNGSSSAYDAPTQTSTTIGAAILSFREFLGVMVSVSLGVPDKGIQSHHSNHDPYPTLSQSTPTLPRSYL